MKEKKEIIEKYGRNNLDTGSPNVQIALLTERINYLTGHMQSHRKDFHSRRGLLALVSKRRGLLKYLAVKDYKKYEELATALKIRHN
jgi:small subunit ribosomal protein S15